MIRFFRLALPFCCIAMIAILCRQQKSRPRILLFTKTADYKHTSIPAGIEAIRKLGEANGFDVDTTQESFYFNDDSLKRYATVVFLNTTGDILDNRQQTAFERYIQSGGAFVGIHAAADAEYDWRWYGRLVGGYFESHPAIQQATVNIKQKEHPATEMLPSTWSTTDEWYNYKTINPSIQVLMTLDEKSYTGGRNGADHPIAWYHEYDGGRAFYTGLGHVEEKYTDPLYLKHLLGGIRYAIGDNTTPDYEDAESAYAPDEDRFTKTMLTQGTLTEPTEMAILPNLDILIAQRRGEIMLLKNGASALQQVAALDVYWKTSVQGVNAEEGLMGIQADPDFADNHWIYTYYSPTGKSVNRLSRFQFVGDRFDTASEQVILELYSQRDICCHTGGSIAFGPDRILYLSTGDNSTPFDEPGQRFVNHGFAPLDSRPGHHQYDARRSAGNTNDLRGKILRIRVKDDGTYEIPEGNLFTPSPQTKPEIFVMGNRNPYRIAVDAKNGFLYWGEVGPDASNDSLQTRGPRGYDEINQARKAGFFGWPLFIANNYAYREYDYATGMPGEVFDPRQPVNTSQNNNGLRQLPPAQPAYIWYPYAPSKEFPQVGSGGRTAMAGGVYYADRYPKETRYADYYDGKLFIYEWIRGWIKVVTMQPNGDFEKIEPFMLHTKFSAPMDMELGPDGRIYVLEYGSGWFSKNPDAGVSRIDFNSGNRPPKVAKLSVSKQTGALPFRVTATVDAKDPEGDPVTYLWDLGTGLKKETKTPRLDITYGVAGDYGISVTVIDQHEASATSEVVSVYAGNETPEVDIRLTGNRSFYFPGIPVHYEVVVTDKDEKQPVDLSGLQVIADFVKGTDKAAVPAGHLSVSEATIGRNVMLSYDCKSCHTISEKSVGPSFTEVAAKYKNDPDATGYLIDKIRKGGGGVWGEVAMSAHPDLPENDLRQIVKWVMSLSGEADDGKKSLPATGSIQPSAGETGLLYLTSTYTDKGGAGIKPMTGKTTLILRNTTYRMFDIREVSGFNHRDSAGTRYLITPGTTASFLVDSIDLHGLMSADVVCRVRQPLGTGYRFELRLDKPNGAILGASTFTALPANNVLNIPLKIVPDRKLHKVYLISSPIGRERSPVEIELIRFNPAGGPKAA